jgi:WD40 repeat protein
MTSVALSNNQRYALTAETHQIGIWDATSGQPSGFSRIDGKILSTALSNQGPFALLGLDTYSALFINLNKSIAKHLSHTDRVNSVAIAMGLDNAGNDKEIFIGLTGSDDNKARLWNLNNGQIISSATLDDPINHVNLSPDSRWALIATQHGGWSVREAQNLSSKTIISSSNRIDSVVASNFSPNGQQLLLGNTTRRITLWDLTTQRVKSQWSVPKKNKWSSPIDRIMSIGFNKAGDAVKCITSSGMLYEWSLKKPSPSK